MRKIKYLSLIIVGILLVVFVIFAGLYVFTPVVDNALLNLANKYSGKDLRIHYDNLSGNLFGTLKVDGLQVIYKSDTLLAKQVYVNYDLLDLLGKRISVHRLEFEQPRYVMHLNDSAAVDTLPAPNIDSLLAALNPKIFPSIAIGNMAIYNGTLLLVTPDSTHRFARLNLALRARLTPKIARLNINELSGIWENRNIILNRLQLKARSDWQVAQIEELVINLAGLRLTGMGSADLKPHLKWTFHLTEFSGDLASLNTLGVALPYRSGNITATAEFNGSANHLHADLQANATADDLKVEQFRGAINYDFDERIAIENLLLASNFGSLQGQAQKSGNNYQLNLVFNQIDLKKLGYVGERGRLNGHIQGQLSGESLKTLSGNVQLQLQNLVYDQIKIDQVLVNITAQNGNIVFIAPSQITASPQFSFQIEGNISRKNIANIRIKSTRGVLDSLTQRLGVSGLGGSGSVNLVLTGPISDPSVKGVLYLDSLTYENTVVYGVDGVVEIEQLASNRIGFFDLEIATGYVNDVFLTSGQIKMRLQGNEIFFKPFQFFSQENAIITSGVLTFGDRFLNLKLDNFQLIYEKYNIQNITPVEVTMFDSDSLIIKPFRLIAAESGELYARGVLYLNSESKNSRAVVELKNIRLTPLNEYIYWPHTIDGYLDTNIDLYGVIDNPDIDLNLNLHQLTVDERDLGKLYADFTISDRRLSVNVISYEDSSGSYLDVNGNVEFEMFPDVDSSNIAVAKDIPLGFNVVFGNFQLSNYAFLFNTNVPVAGAFTGRLDIGGSWQKPMADLAIEAEKVKFGEYEFPLMAIEADMTPQKLSIQKANINFLNTNIKLHGEKSLRWNPDSLNTVFDDKYLELYAEIKEDSLNFLHTINPELERLVGDIRIQVAVKGDYDALQFTKLDFSVKNGAFYLAKVENSIKNIQASGHLENTRLVFDELRGQAPKPRDQGSFLKRIFRNIKSWFVTEKERGYIAAEGWVDFAEVLRPKVYLRATADHAYFNYFIENTEVVVDTRNLTVAGRDTIVVSGDITIVEGDVEFDFVESEKNLLLETTYREKPPYVVYNLNIEIPSNFNVRSYAPLNSFDISVNGSVRVISKPNSPELEMYGSLSVSGVYFVQGEEFQIENGSINFPNPKELPELNLTAQTYKKDQIRNQNLIFLLTVRGKIDSPEKEIVIQDEQGNVLNYDVKDKLALLLFGMTFDQLSGAGAQDVLLSRGEQVLSQALISTIEREARTFTGLDQIRLDSQEGFFSSKLNQPATLSLGKYLTPNLYLEYRSRLAATGLGNVPSPQLSWEAGNQIYLQYRLNKHWSFSTIYQKTLQGNNKVQLDINWQTGF
jgi:hypothetical protein